MLSLLKKLAPDAPPDSNLLNILRLTRSENIGPRTFYNLIKYYGSTTTAVANLPEFIKRSGNNKIKLCSTDVVLKEIDTTYKAGVHYILYTDQHYSSLLKTIDNPPPVLTYKGNVSLMNRAIAGVVGSRNCSIAGKQLATRLAGELARAEVVVCSGLARGIDTAAHQASLPYTIGVIAGGIGNIYPPENHKLTSV